MVKTRDEVPEGDRWNVDALYSSPAEWNKAFDSFITDKQKKPYWPELEAFKGTLGQGAHRLKEVLEKTFHFDRILSKLYTYAHLRHDEDITNPVYKKSYEQILSVAHTFAQETAWMQPELLALPNVILESYLTDQALKDYHFYLEKIVRSKKHTLSPEGEMLMAQAGQALQTAHKAFSAINDADFQFGSVEDSEGVEKPLSHGSYGIYIREQDRTLRERAFKKYHQKYLSYENTLCELLTGQIQNHQFNAQARNYSSCLEEALFPKNIPTSVYHALVQAVNNEIGVLHRYMDLRKRVLQLDELHLYDIYVPLTKNVDIQIPYKEAEELVIESVAPLGSEYQNLLLKGLKEHRWVDRYENKNKRSGAYSSGCFDSMPYILMNYKNILRDVFTLAHEAGHSMHSLYSRNNQPYHYSDYPIFLAEVASTFNEDLLTRLMIERCTDPTEKIFLINQKVEDIRGTLFRQTMFAEFELLIHQHVEQGTPLTPQLLKQEYRQLNQKYYGPSVIIDEEIDIEWARIPHFYYNFYVYQYATGISAAIDLAEIVCTGGAKEREAYLTFLKSGSSRYPIDTLKLAGVDMESPVPVQAAIHKFDQLVEQLDGLLTEQAASKG
jgi:oligoendopeptidase F